MGYEIERKLDGKIDKWEFHALQSKVTQLDNNISRLEKQVADLQSSNNNKYYVIERLCSLLAEQECFTEISNQIIEIKHLL